MSTFCPTLKGLEELVHSIDHAVTQTDPGKITDELRGTLCRLIRHSEIQWPQSLFEAKADGYARREIYTSESFGYSVVAMTWGPGQGTKIHDHCGMWCVEGVWSGELEVVQYELTDKDQEKFKFEQRGVIRAGLGSAGSLIPPHEYHTISNASESETAVSIHIYSGVLKQCSVFSPLSDGWYQREDRKLNVDH